MALVLTGFDVVNIAGSYGGTYFSKDKSGLHMRAKPRSIKRRTPAQNIQRRAFTMARAYSHDNRTVSYNIFRALWGLNMQEPPLTFPQIPPEIRFQDTV